MALQNQTLASTADSSQAFGAAGLLSSEQSQQIFQIYVRKAEEERAAAAKKAELELECMKKESDARIAATTTNPLGKDSIVIGKIPTEVQTLSIRFAGLPQDEIAKIFHNKFQPINLYRLRNMQGLRYETYHDQGETDIEDDMSSSMDNAAYKAFGNSFDEVWSEAFINYKSILISLFGATVPNLHLALANFYINILQLAKVYEWQEAVLPLAIKIHSHIVCLRPSDPSNWVIPPEVQGRFCTTMTVLGMSSLHSQGKRKRFQSPPSRRPSKQAGGVSNNPTVSCELIIKGPCDWSGCEREHKRKGDRSRRHGQASRQPLRRVNREERHRNGALVRPRRFSDANRRSVSTNSGHHE